MDDIQKIAVQQGMITMKQDGYMKALEGTTTIEEISCGRGLDYTYE